MADRQPIGDDVIARILIRSGRRCCLCFGLKDDLSEKDGQIAHVDHDSSNAGETNLVYLCLDHHNKYDTRFSQSKRITEAEIYHYRDRLYSARGQHYDHKWTITLEVDGDSVAVLPLVQEIERICGARIALREVRKGSIILGLQSAAVAYVRIRELFETGQLIEILGLKVVDVGPEQFNASRRVIDLASDLIQQSRIDDAIQALEIATKDTHDVAELWIALGEAYLEKHRICRADPRDNSLAIKAENSLMRAFQIGHISAELWSSYAAVIVELGDNDGAIECIKHALRIDPSFGGGWYNMGVLQWNLGKQALALEALRKAASLGYKGADDLVQSLAAKLRHRKR